MRKKSLLIVVLLFFLGFLSKSYSQFSADRPDLRLCGSAPDYYLGYFNCTSNNYTLVDVFLSLTDVNGVPLTNTTCTIGTPQDVYVLLDYTSNSASPVYHARMFADLNIDGSVQQLNVNFGTVNPGAGQIALYGPFSWICGQEISLENILIVWKTSGDDTELVPYTCSSYSKAQCDLPGDTVVSTPLAVEFSYTACTVGNLTTVSFTSETIGGTPPYNYFWDFDNNGTTDSTLENPTHVYNNTLSYSALLTVVDDLGLSNTYLLPIVYPTELQISGSITPVGCTTTNDGEIDLTISGGTPPYSILWSTGDTTEDLINLSGGTYNVQVTDAYGCIKTDSFILNNGDTVDPILTVPSNQTLQGCDTNVIASSYLPYSTTVTTITLTDLQNDGGDATDDSVITSITYIDVANGSCPIVVTRTFTVTDNCNNQATGQTIYTIEDTTAPVVDNTAGDLDATLECSDAAGIAAALALAPTATDNCTAAPTINLVSDVTTPDATCANAYVRVRTWNFSDGCGNISTNFVQTITVQDTTAPVVDNTAGDLDATLECSDAAAIAAALALAPTASDNCTAAPTINLVSDVTTPDATCANAYVRVRTWNFSDGCGNTSTNFVQTITVQDTTAPTFIGDLPNDITIECNENIPTADTIFATDNCGIAVVTFDETITQGSCPSEYIITREWTATDLCGLTTTHVQTITVEDNTPPTFINVPDNEVYVMCDGIPSVANISAQDNCGNVSVDFDETVIEGECLNKYSINRVWTATDECGNNSEFSQVLYVACDIKIFNAVSPNGDGKNDIFYIEGIDCFPNNTLEIYNRWGIKIYEIKNYDNVSNVFTGYSNKSSSVSGHDLLPAGTYFYILKYEYEFYGTNRRNVEKTGYLYIQRN